MAEKKLSDIISCSRPSPEDKSITSQYSQVIKFFFEEAHLTPRQKDILERRFGLSGKKETLEEIGYSYGLTRERIRQNEADALKKVQRVSRWYDLTAENVLY